MLRQIGWWIRKGPIRKNRVLLVTTLFFLKILFQFKNLLERVDLMYQQPTQISIFLLFVSARVLFDGAFFHVSILKSYGFCIIVFRSDLWTQHQSLIIKFNSETAIFQVFLYARLSNDFYRPQKEWSREFKTKHNLKNNIFFPENVGQWRRPSRHTTSWGRP